MVDVGDAVDVRCLFTSVLVQEEADADAAEAAAMAWSHG